MAALRIALVAACVAMPTLASAHGGTLDAYGCHHNRGAGGYHCHKGPLAGQTFISKDAMLKAQAKRKTGPTRRP